MPNMITNFTAPVTMTVTPSLVNTYVPSTASASILPTVTPTAQANIYDNSPAKMSKLSKKQLKALAKEQKQLLRAMPADSAVIGGYTDPYNTDETQNLPDRLPGGILYGTKLLEVLAQAPSTSKCIGNTSFWIQCDKKNVLPIVQHMFSLSSKVITLERQEDFAMQIHPIGNTYEVAFIDYINKRSIGLVNLTRSEVESITPTFNILNKDKTTTEPTTIEPTTDEDLLATTELDDTAEETATPEEPVIGTEANNKGFPFGTVFGTIGGVVVAAGAVAYALCRRGRKDQETPVESFISGPVSEQGPRDLMGDLRKEHHTQVATNGATETEHLVAFDQHVGEVRTKMKGEQASLDLESGLLAESATVHANGEANTYEFVPVSTIPNAPQLTTSAPALPPLPPELLAANTVTVTKPLSVVGQQAINPRRSRRANFSHNPDDLLSGIVPAPVLPVATEAILPGQIKTPSPQVKNTGILSQLLAQSQELDPQALVNSTATNTVTNVNRPADSHSDRESSTGYEDSPTDINEITVKIVADSTNTLNV